MSVNSVMKRYFFSMPPRDRGTFPENERNRENERRSERERRALEIVEAMEAQLRALRVIVMGDGGEGQDEGVTH